MFFFCTLPIRPNAKIFLDAVFQKYQPVCYKVSKIILQDFKSFGLKNKNDISGAAEVFSNAVVIDLNNLWYGYFCAHGFGNCAEFYTLQKFLDVEESLKKITFYTEKNVVRENYLNALKNVPYDMEIYNQAKILLGEDKNLEKYKSLFTQDFKRGSFQKNLSTLNSKNQQNQKKKNVKDIVMNFSEDSNTKFDSHIYYYCDGAKSSKKFSSARKSYAKIKVGEEPLILYDSTIFGSAEDGFVATNKGIWIHDGEGTKFYSYRDIKKFEIKGFVSDDLYINGTKKITNSLPGGYTAKLHKILYTIKETILENEKIDSLSSGKKTLTKKIYDDLLANLNRNYRDKFTLNVYIYGPNKKCQEKFKNATEAYAKLSEGERPLICYDMTVFGTATDGFVLTTKGMHLHNKYQNPEFFSWKTTSNIKFKNDKIFINEIEVIISNPSNEVEFIFKMMKEVREKMIQYL